MRKKILAKRLITFMLALTMVLSNTMAVYAAPEGEPEPTRAVVDETETDTTEEESSVEESSVEESEEETTSETEEELSEGETEELTTEESETETEETEKKAESKVDKADVKTDKETIELDDTEHVLGYRHVEGEDDFESLTEKTQRLRGAGNTSYIPTNIPDLRNQGSYGTCWAHSSMALAELSLISQGKVTADSIDLSELHLAYFAYHTATDPLGGIKDSNAARDGDFLQIGGSLSLSQYALFSWAGPAKEEDFPYSDCATVARDGLDAAYAYESETHLRTSYKIDLVNDRAEAQQLIRFNGGIGASFYAYTSEEAAYSLGVYDPEYHSFYDPDYPGESNHAVTIVGWDDNFSKDNFPGDEKPENDGAWLIRNSWKKGPMDDKHWGYTGYFWMSYYSKGLDSSGYAFIFDDKDNYDHNYQYDGSMQSVYWSPLAKSANVFHVPVSSTGELLEAVAFDTRNSNVTYNIKVYKNPVDATDPESGELEDQVLGTTTFAGYYTIPLNNGVLLDAGDTFTVVVTLEKEGETPSVSMESDMDSFIVCNASAEEGQSFYYYNGRWNDLGKEYDENVRIKAFTSDMSSGGSVDPESITFTEDIKANGITLNINETKRVLPVIRPTNTTNRGVTWTSSNENIATVTNGTVKGIAKGTATITATTVAGGYSDTFTATVKNGITSLVIDGPNAVAGDQSVTYIATYYPENAELTGEVEWSSSDPSVLEIDSVTGEVSVVGVGTVTITALLDGTKATKKVVVGLDAPRVTITTDPEDNTITLSWDAVGGAEYYEVKDGSGNLLKKINVDDRQTYTYVDKSHCSEVVGNKYAYFVYATRKTSSGTSSVYSGGWGYVYGERYAINYVMNGAINDPNNPTYYRYGMVNVRINTPTPAEGYKTAGWKLDENALSYYPYYLIHSQIDDANAVREDLTFYAYNGDPIRYKVILQDDKSNTEQTATMNYDSEWNLPTRGNYSGYRFIGWNTSADGSGTMYEGGELITKLSKVDNDIIRLYAIWEYDVTLNANGGSVSPTTLAVRKGLNYGWADGLPTPTKSGSSFAGWYTELGGGTLVTNDTIVNNPLKHTLYAHWTNDSYTVSFDSNGGSAVSYQLVDKNGYASEPTAPTKAGYDFGGWYKEPACTNEWHFDTDKVTDNTTLYAKWNIKKYTVTFDSKGGSAVDPVLVDYNTTVSKPSDPIWAGYIFGGWYKDSACTNAWNFTTDKVTRATTLYAKWTALQCTVTFDSKGGTAVNSVDLSYNSLVTKPADPTKTHYTFDKWYMDENCSTPWDFENHKVTSSITLYAGWTPVKYEVTFDSQGGTEVASENIDYNSTFTAPTAPTKEHYSFDGWYKESTCINPWNFDSDKVTGATTLYAKWTINKHTVTFNSQGGSNVSSVNVDYGNTITEPTAPTRTGYTFGGWYKEEVCENVWNFDSDKIAGDTTLYAKWAPIKYTITFDSQGGTTVDHIEVDYDATIPRPTDPTKNEATFAGWFTERTCEQNKAWNFDSYKVTGATTLYAKWTVNEYTVTFVTDNGIAIPAQTIEYDHLVSKPQDDPVKPGYKFGGWYKSSTYATEWDFETDKVVGNTSIYAKWIKVIDSRPISMSETDAPIEPGRKLSLSSEIEGADVYYKIKSNTNTNIDVHTGDILDIEGLGLTRFDDLIVLRSDRAEDYENDNDKKVITVYAVATKTESRNIVALCEPVSLTYYIVNEANDWGDIDDTIQGELLTTDKIPSNLWIHGVKDKDYTGSAVTMDDLKVFYGKKQLSAGTDYTVKYANNVKAGTATVTVTGKGNYSGTVVRSFNIKQLDLANSTTPDIFVTYTGKVQKGTTTVTYTANGRTVTLKAGTDYTYSYPGTNSKQEGYNKTAFVGVKNTVDTTDGRGYEEYEITIIGKGNYSGEKKFKQRIYAKDDTTCTNVSKFSIAAIPAKTLLDANIEGEVCPEPIVKITKKVNNVNQQVTLNEGTDYTLKYSNNDAIGTAMIAIIGKGEYCGTRYVTFKINGLPMSKASFVILDGSKTISKPYSGNAIEPDGYKLVYGNGTTLYEGKDYTVSYANNINVGKNKATMVFTGKGAYSGTIKKTFNITAVPLVNNGTEVAGFSVEMNDDVVTKDNNGVQSSYPDYAYTKGGVKPNVVVRYNGSVLKSGTDYTIKYANNTVKHEHVNDAWKNNKIPTVTITFKGNYSGSVTRQFQITGSGVENVTMTASDVVYSRKSNICKPSIALYDSNGTKLAAGTDYEKVIKYVYVKDTTVERYENRQYVKYDITAGTEVGNKDIIPNGTAIRAIATGKNNYAKDGADNKISKEFRFISADISNASVKIADQIYTGRAIELTKDDFATIKIGKTVLTKSDFDIVPDSYINNVNKGTAKVTIKGKGGYGGTKIITFKIVNKSMNFVVNYDNNKVRMDGLLGVDNVFKGTVAKNTIAEGGKLAVNKYSLANYTFAGWNTKADGSGKTYTSGGKFIADDYLLGLGYGSEVTMYAQWIPTPYKLTYKLNGGIAMADYPGTYDITDTVDLTTYANPVREGYAFGGWYYDSRCVSKPMTPISVGSSGNKTIYAKWVVKQTTWDKVVCIGDSLTEPNLSNGKDYSYPAYLQSILQSHRKDVKVEVTNLGVGGAVVYNREDADDPILNLGDSLDPAYRSEVDAVFYMAGVCDWFLGGEVINAGNKTIDPATYLTGYTASIDAQFTHLAALYPNATIYVVPVFNPSEPLGLAGEVTGYTDPYAYLDALRNVQVTKAAGRSGFVVVNTVSSGIFDGTSASVKKQYFKDSVHLNSTGYKLLATILAEYGY